MVLSEKEFFKWGHISERINRGKNNKFHTLQKLNVKRGTI